MAEEVKHLFRVAWEDPEDPDKVWLWSSYCVSSLTLKCMGIHSCIMSIFTGETAFGLHIYCLDDVAFLE